MERSLETMPEWAQEVVVNQALNLIGDEDAKWAYRGSSKRIVIEAHGFQYVVTPSGIGY